MPIAKLTIAILAAFLASNASAHSGADEVVQIGYISSGDGTIPVMRETTSARFEIAPSDVGLPGQLVLIYQSASGTMAVLTPDGWKGFTAGLAEPLLYTPSLEPTYSVVFFDAAFYASGVRPQGFPFTDKSNYQYGMTGAIGGGLMWTGQPAAQNSSDYQSTDYSRFPGVLINARIPNYENSSLCGALEQKGYGSGTIYAAYGALQPEAEERIEQFHAAKNPKLTPEHLRNVYIELDGRQGHKYSAVINLQCTGGLMGDSGAG